MDYVEAEGDSIDEAIESALRKLGAEREKVTIDILSEGKRGILGIGAKKARIRASLRKSIALSEAPKAVPEPEKPTAEGALQAGESARAILAEIVRLLGVEAEIDVRSGELEGEVILEIRAADSGLLIGRRGQTLEALEYLLTRMVSGKEGREGPQIVVDTEGYRERRRKSLEDMALRLGEKAKRQRKAVTVGDLSARDRRIIHAVLQDDPWLTTKSIGQGAYRRLLIIPEGDRKRKEQEKRPDSPASGTPRRN